MPITRHHSGRWLYQFDREIPGAGRKRANKLLPKGWTRAEAEAFDLRETARRYALETGVQRQGYLIEESVLLYLQHRAPNLKNRDDIEGAFLHLHPYILGRPLDALPDVAREYANDSPDLKPGTVRNRLSYLRAACRWAWKHHGRGEHDPAERMVLPVVKNARHVYLSRTEANRIFRAMGYGYARDAARVAYYTGWRISEVLRATAKNETGGWVLSITDSKNGLPRKVPVHESVLYLARDFWPPKVTAWTVSKAFKAAARGVGLGHARLHDLRHSAASEMVNAGFDLYTVGGVLGHKSAVSTARYAHLAQERLREAVRSIGKVQPRPQAKAA